MEKNLGTFVSLAPLFTLFAALVCLLSGSTLFAYHVLRDVDLVIALATAYNAIRIPAFVLIFGYFGLYTLVLIYWQIMEFRFAHARQK